MKNPQYIEFSIEQGKRLKYKAASCHDFMVFRFFRYVIANIRKLVTDEGVLLKTMMQIKSRIPPDILRDIQSIGSVEFSELEGCTSQHAMDRASLFLVQTFRNQNEVAESQITRTERQIYC